MIQQPYSAIKKLIWDNKLTTLNEIYLRIPLKQLCEDAAIAPSLMKQWLFDISTITMQEVKQLAGMLEIPEYRMMRIVLATEKMQQAQRN